MSRTTTAASVAAATLALSATHLGGAAAADTGSGFTPVRTTGYTAQSITSPTPGRLFVAGIDSSKHVVVEDQVNGQVVAGQTLAATADRVQIASSGTSVWLLATGATPSLWRMQNQQFAPVALPTAATPLKLTSLIVQGTDVSILGATQDGGTPYGRARPTLSRLLGGQWQTSTFFTDNTVVPFIYPDSSAATATTTQGHILGLTRHTGWSPTTTFSVDDYSLTPPKSLGDVGTINTLGAEHTTAVLAGSVSDISLWGYAEGLSATPGHEGHCLHIQGSTTAPCPAPSYPVAAAARIADGRQVVGGRDSSTPGGPAAGYAVATPDGSLTPLSGDPGRATVGMTVEPGTTTVWSIASDGSTTSLQRAVLPGGPVSPSGRPSKPCRPTWSCRRL